MKLLRVSLLWLSLSAWVFAQATGGIAGTILTEAGVGVPVPNAQVRVTNTATGTSAATQSRADGSYSVSGLTPGAYELSIQTNPPLFLPFSRRDIQVEAGQLVRVDVRLQDGQLGTLGDGGEQFAQMLASRNPALKGSTPRMRDGKPDLSGVWLSVPAVPVGDPPELLPWAEAEARTRNARMAIDSPQTHCLPMGLSFTGFFTPIRLVQTQKLIVLIDENGDPPRQIYLDGRTHPKLVNPSYMGHSIGTWDKDTLVVETVGFNDRIWLTFGNFPQTEQMRVLERFRRSDLGHLEVELTFDDPGAFKKPWTIKRVSTLAPETFELFEYVCAENNRDVGHLVGR
jgi:Carboxypeptidase regulatory-like domain